MKTILICVLIAAILVLSWRFYLAGNEQYRVNAFLKMWGTNEIKSLTAGQAAELVANSKFKMLFLDGLTSIDKDVAQELAKFGGGYLCLGNLTSIDKDLAQELAKFEGTLGLGLTSIDKDVAQELTKFGGEFLSLGSLTSIDKDVLKILKSNTKIELPDEYSDKKD